MVPFAFLPPLPTLLGLGADSWPTFTRRVRRRRGTFVAEILCKSDEIIRWEGQPPVSDSLPHSDSAPSKLMHWSTGLSYG